MSVAAATNSLALIVFPLREQPSVSLVREVEEGNCGYVLKREWSGSAHHVYAPTKDIEGALANFKERIQFEKEILAEMSPTSPFWTLSVVFIAIITVLAGDFHRDIFIVSAGDFHSANFTVLPNTKISANSMRMGAGGACSGPGGPK